MCCQEMGEKEATVALFCPKAAYDEPKVRKVKRINYMKGGFSSPLNYWGPIFKINNFAVLIYGQVCLNM